MTALALSVADGVRFELGRAVIGVAVAVGLFAAVMLVAVGIAACDRLRRRRNRRQP